MVVYRRGRSRCIPPMGSKKTDLVLFTDVSAPSSNPDNLQVEMISPVIMSRWFPRKTQTCMIELLAVVAAIEILKDHHQRKLVLIRNRSRRL